MKSRTQKWLCLIKHAIVVTVIRISSKLPHLNGPSPKVTSSYHQRKLWSNPPIMLYSIFTYCYWQQNCCKNCPSPTCKLISLLVPPFKCLDKWNELITPYIYCVCFRACCDGVAILIFKKQTLTQHYWLVLLQKYKDCRRQIKEFENKHFEIMFIRRLLLLRK